MFERAGSAWQIGVFSWEIVVNLWSNVVNRGAKPPKRPGRLEGAILILGSFHGIRCFDVRRDRREVVVTGVSWCGLTQEYP